MVIVEDAGYTHDASGKTITLAAPFDALSLGQVTLIKNMTTGTTIWDIQKNNMSISIAAAVITYTYDDDNSNDTDLLHIEISSGSETSATSPAYTNHSITGTADGRKVVAAAGTRVALAASTAMKEVTITAETDNTDLIVVGGATVVASLSTRQGTPLYPGDSATIEGDDLADIYLDSIVSGEGVTYTYLT